MSAHTHTCRKCKLIYSHEIDPVWGCQLMKFGLCPECDLQLKLKFEEVAND